LRRKSTGGGRRLEGEEEEGSCRGELRGERTVEMLVGRGREREREREREKPEKVDGITYSEFPTPP
jgi:hypothetical protein